MSGKNKNNNIISEDEFENIPMINLSSFDIEEYISQYSSSTNKIRRLLFISQTSPELSEKALHLALDELRSIYEQYGTMDFNCFAYIHNKLNLQLDKSSLEQMEKKSTLKLEKLTNELNNSRNSQIRESIRIGTNELGDFYSAQGDIESALKTYYKLKENCTSPLNVIDMCFKIIKIYASNLKISSAINYIAKAEKTTNISSAIQSQIACSNALVFLEEQKYKTAAHFFISSSAEIFNTFADVISASDVAIYASLCALATFERADLKANVLNHKEFKGLLELVPPIRELLLDFYHSRYSSAMKSLDQIMKYLRNDMYLHGHIDSLVEKIRNNAIVQYCKPFISISLNEMSIAFNTSLQQIEKDLLTLIINGHIKARIDSHNKILYAHDKDERALTFERALKMGEIHLRNTKAFVLRSNFIVNDISVSNESGGGGGEGQHHKNLRNLHMRPSLGAGPRKQKTRSNVRMDHRRPRI